jgi:integrase/recombinase XerD
LQEFGTPPHDIATQMNETLAERQLFSAVQEDDARIQQIFDAAEIASKFALELAGADDLIAEFARLQDLSPATSALSGDVLGLGRLAQFSGRLTDKAPAPTRHQANLQRTATAPLTGARAITPSISGDSTMPGKQAKVITPPMVRRMLRHVSRSSSFPARDRAMILLSVKAGLRACEIAGLDWSMVLDAQGRVSGTIHVRDVIAKKRGGRRIPMHPDLRRALETLARTVEPVGPVIRSYRGGHLKANSLVNWFVALYRELGYEGCSSHSGRRSFITVAARNIHRSGCSLRDVQLLAGHRSIETTERYIDGDTCAQRRLVAYI